MTQGITLKFNITAQELLRTPRRFNMSVDGSCATERVYISLHGPTDTDWWVGRKVVRLVVVCCRFFIAVWKDLIIKFHVSVCVFNSTTIHV